MEFIQRKVRRLTTGDLVLTVGTALIVLGLLISAVLV